MLPKDTGNGTTRIPMWVLPVELDSLPFSGRYETGAHREPAESLR